MNEIARQISQIGIMPVIKLTYPDRDALPLADVEVFNGLQIFLVKGKQGKKTNKKTTKHSEVVIDRT